MARPETTNLLWVKSKWTKYLKYAHFTFDVWPKIRNILDLYVVVSYCKQTCSCTAAGTRIYVYIDHIYRNKMEGLCGNYDGVANNDFDHAGNDDLTTTAQAFGNSWRTTSSCPATDKSLSDDYDPCSDNAERSDWAVDSCRIIMTGETFAACREQVGDYMDYYKECLFDACGWVQFPKSVCYVGSMSDSGQISGQHWVTNCLIL